MKTKYYRVDPVKPDTGVLTETAALLRQGDLVAFPTETVYGLGANGLNEQAVKAIYQAKGRPSDNPLILHIDAVAKLDELAATVPANARALAERFWPGPLTVVVERQPKVPDAVTGGLNTVAVRLPSSVVARELIRLAGVPVAAPSANTSGRPSPTTAQAVLADLDGKIAAVIDAGPCEIGVESTVVDCTTPVPTLLRPGGITYEMLLAVLGEVEVDPTLAGSQAVPKSPGMKYTHYAPLAPLILVEAEPAAAAMLVKREVEQALAAGKRVGAIVSGEVADILPARTIKAVYGVRADAAAIAASLYTMLRSFDDKPVDIIYAEGIAENGLGLAVMNRLRKAAGYHIIRA
ncbi:L-threonylcarbamoyladenylate synthase [Sporomusa acidovorans]|uniref:Threonylcarbamoyl-AMP synthase n=1 Tax=Sporomusa acidovorans (strain ATCC 49682 / DSM 3132 / Mol) TaxID=1123286 RepID=A0ABZ3J789_SPOA4|nr:L-threonylcarbamoyladenylate synthase [Sporomusa acidovorans]OZC21201.1 threonylcarbamoyl-AMP synthase [Sporomusa acidovorans DSM 3132]SDE64572.1 L-threonylcarbamoyladenylate synthase [Sporomusa acidovorans]